MPLVEKIGIGVAAGVGAAVIVGGSIGGALNHEHHKTPSPTPTPSPSPTTEPSDEDSSTPTSPPGGDEDSSPTTTMQSGPSLPPTPEAGTCLLETNVSKGDKVLPVICSPGFEVGEEIVIDSGTPVEESNKIVGFGSLILESPLKFDHAAGAPIAKVNASSGSSTLNGRVVDKNPVGGKDNPLTKYLGLVAGAVGLLVLGCLGFTIAYMVASAGAARTATRTRGKTLVPAPTAQSRDLSLVAAVAAPEPEPESVFLVRDAEWGVPMAPVLPASFYAPSYTQIPSVAAAAPLMASGSYVASVPIFAEVPWEAVAM